MKRIYSIWLLALFSLSAQVMAHTSSEAYLSLHAEAKNASGVWEFALTDLEVAVGIDSDSDQKMTWAEVKARRTAIVEYLLSGISIQQAGQQCQINAEEFLLNNRSGLVYLYIPVTMSCAENIAQLDIDYQLFFQHDVRHHAFWNLNSGASSQTRISSDENRSIKVDFSEQSVIEGFQQFFIQGIWHIWIGFDHILFLVLLILSVENSLQPLSGSHQRRQRVWRVLKTVTAFTLSHSLTMALAISGWISLSSSWVESMIALSVILAGLNVMFKWIDERLWLFAFLFGLLHGFGFASVLSDLGLSAHNLVISLLGFNLGVEAGQLFIIVLSMPIVTALSRMKRVGVYIKHVMTSSVIMLATFWFIQRLAW